MDSTSDTYNRPLTHRDLDDTPDDGNRYEVIDGELHVSPFPTHAHQRALSELFGYLWAHVREKGTGRVFAPGLKVVLDLPTGIGPDIVFIANAHLDRMEADGFYGAPDLVVEVISSKPALDRVVKFRKYAAAGVANYWIVDPERRMLQAFALAAEKFRLVHELKDNDVFKPELFPELSIDLRDLWW